MIMRQFSFPLAVLAGEGRRLYGAMTDADDAVPMADRLNIGIITPTDNLANHLDVKIAAVGTGQASQNAQTGQAGNLTKERTADFQEIKQSIAGVRQGWTTADSTALAASVSQLSDASPPESAAADDHVGLARQTITATNAVYADALRIQNDARLQPPMNQPGDETARTRFLLDEFPSRDRLKPPGGTQTLSTTPTPSSGIMALGA